MMEPSNTEKSKLDIKIRYAEEKDIERIHKIYAYYVLNDVATFEEEVPSTEEMNQRRLDIQVKNKLPYYVATITIDNDDFVVGYSYVSYYRTRSAYRFTLEDSIYLDYQYLGYGIGSLLLQQLIIKTRELGFKQMIAVIGGFNEASIKLHEKYQFSNLSVLKSVGFKFNKWIDVYVLQLSL
ncbi:hypothetical protein DLAC_01954 [Tieghemostelium lacteum]|uniref:N-acetyltransferase domain-containing protein n=1 Tax=Tieghemostelium lacteum TaxID=361077 RepID=A0A152A549_TIELA|nr:hypothetical protein DLAC_01954 [Tieghemostelium lacteum]|eukprot:KYR01366.1 hypothetical protein DLAC_01954 [Tieghemostelium lacteum]